MEAAPPGLPGLTARSSANQLPAPAAKPAPSASSAASALSTSSFGAPIPGLPLPPAFASALKDFEALESVLALLKKRGKLGVEWALGAQRAALAAASSGRALPASAAVPVLSLPALRPGVETYTGRAFTPEALGRILAIAPAAYRHCMAKVHPSTGDGLSTGGGAWSPVLDFAPEQDWPGASATPPAPAASSASAASTTASSAPAAMDARKQAFVRCLRAILEEHHARHLAEEDRSSGGGSSSGGAGEAAAELGGSQASKKQRLSPASASGEEGGASAHGSSSSSGQRVTQWHQSFRADLVPLPQPIVFRAPAGVSSTLSTSSFSVVSAAGACAAQAAAAAASAAASAPPPSSSGAAAPSAASAASRMVSAPAPPAPAAAAACAEDEALIDELLREQPSLRGFKRSTLLGMIKRSSSRVGCSLPGGAGGAVGASAAGAAAAALTVRLAHVAPRLLGAIVGALRTPPPTRSRIFYDELCSRVSAHMTSSTTAPVSVKDVEEFVDLLAGEVAPDWCLLGELQAEVSALQQGGGGGGGGSGGGGAPSGRARMLAAAAATAPAAARPAATRRVFKLTPAGMAGLSGSSGGLALEAVMRRVEKWAEERRPR